MESQSSSLSEKHIHHVFAVTFSYLCLNFMISRLLRLATKYYVSDKYQEYLYDMISTFQAISCSLENSVTKRTYGIFAYWIQLTSLGIYHKWTVTPDSCGNVCGNFVKLLQHNQSGWKCAFKIFLQLSAGLLAWRYANIIWSLEVSHPHAVRYGAVTCNTHLHTEPWKGFLLECGATIFITLLALRGINEIRRFDDVLQSIADSIVTVLGVHLTGMYFNPVNATTQTFGCQGTTYLEHIMVYWLGPLLGCYISVKLSQYRDLTSHETSKNKEAIEGKWDFVKLQDENRKMQKCVLPSSGEEESKKSTTLRQRTGISRNNKPDYPRDIPQGYNTRGKKHEGQG